jgi:hypothetical protein
MGGHADAAKLFIEHYDESDDKKDFIVNPCDAAGMREEMIYFQV